MIPILLSSDEILAGVVVAAKRKIASDERRAAGRPARSAEHYAERPTWDQEIESALAEVAVARWRNRYWMGSHFNGRNAGTDVGKAQVRWTEHAHGHLLIYKEDDLAKPFVLVTGYAPQKLIIGYCYPTEVIRDEFWREPPAVRCASWWLPQTVLTLVHLEAQTA